MSSRYEVIRTYKADLDTNTKRVDESFYDPDTNDLQLLNTKLVTELGGAGSFEFTLPYGHKYYDTVVPLADEFMVRDKFLSKAIFVGRAISVTNTNFRKSVVYCEGALAYLNDILQRPKEWASTTPKEFFRNVIARYNSIKTRVTGYEFQQIHIGECDIPDRMIYRIANYDNTLSLLEKGCTESDGGWFMMSYRYDGEKTINWYKEPPQPSDVQTLEYTENLVSYEEEWDCSRAATIPIILGAQTEEDLPGGQGKKRVGIGGNYEGALYSQGDRIKNGYIEKLYEYDKEGLTSASAVLNAYNEDPVKENDLPYKMLAINANAVDRHFMGTHRKYEIGQKVELANKILLYGDYYNERTSLYVTKIETTLDSAIPTVTIGTLPRRTLSDQFKKMDDRVNEHDRTSSGSSSGGSGSGGSGGNHGGSGSGADLYNSSKGYIFNEDTFKVARITEIGNRLLYDDEREKAEQEV